MNIEIELRLTKMIKKISLIIIFLAGTAGVSMAQSECNYFHRKNCVDKESFPMKYDSQSKSAIMAKGQTSSFHLVAYNGLDYRVTVCADEMIGSQIQFRIYERERVLIKEEEIEAVEEVVEEVKEEESFSEDDYSEDDYSDDYSDDDYSDDYSDDAYSDDAYSDDSYSESSSSSYGDNSSSPVSNEPKFKIVKELLYDNAEDSYSPSIEFTAQGSMSLIIEVSVPGESNNTRKLKINESGCVGVLIEHVKGRHTGF